MYNRRICNPVIIKECTCPSRRARYTVTREIFAPSAGDHCADCATDVIYYGDDWPCADPDADQLSILSEGDSGGASSLIEVIQTMTPEQQQVLLRASAAGTFASLVGNTLLLGAMLCLIPLVSAGQRISALRAIGASAPLLPRLLLLTFLMTLLVQLGFMVLVIRA